MLLVDFTTEIGVNASADIHSEKSYLSYKSYLLTYKKLYHRALAETDIIVDV